MISAGSLTFSYTAPLSSLKVTPADTSAHAVYDFTLTWYAEGGASFTTSQMSLDVGCLNAIITQDPNLVTSSDKNLGESATILSNFKNPTTNITYCVVETN
jgi:hypothetical protein